MTLPTDIERHTGERAHRSPASLTQYLLTYSNRNALAQPNQSRYGGTAISPSPVDDGIPYRQSCATDGIATFSPPSGRFTMFPAINAFLSQKQVRCTDVNSLRFSFSVSIPENLQDPESTPSPNLRKPKNEISAEWEKMCNLLVEAPRKLATWIPGQTIKIGLEYLREERSK